MKKDKLNKKVLIVEDDEDFISILKIKFTSEGFDVVTAKDGEEGISLAESEKPDLIVSDVLMPKMDGLEMAKKIKGANKNAIIIFLTNVKAPIYTENSEGLEGSEYLIKSDLRINEIVDRVKAKLGMVQI